MNRLPRWRIAAAFLILGALVYFLALFAPFYLRNWQLQSFVANLTRMWKALPNPTRHCSTPSCKRRANCISP